MSLTYVCIFREATTYEPIASQHSEKESVCNGTQDSEPTSLPLYGTTEVEQGGGNVICVVSAHRFLFQWNVTSNTDFQANWVIHRCIEESLVYGKVTD